MSKLFCVVSGARLAGKSTLAGTLPGKTVMLQAAVLETGSRSALALAKKRGNDLEIKTFTDLVDFRSKLIEALNDKKADHIYIDGYSAINDMRWDSPDIQAAFRKNNFEAFGKHGDEMSKICLEIKKAAEAKNVFLTCAMKLKQEKDRDEPDVVCEVKGKIAATQLTKLGEVCVSLVMLDIDGKQKRVMLTKEFNKWPGRIDGVLDEDNPGFCEPDLGIVLRLANGVAA